MVTFFDDSLPLRALRPGRFPFRTATQSHKSYKIDYYLAQASQLQRPSPSPTMASDAPTPFQLKAFDVLISCGRAGHEYKLTLDWIQGMSCRECIDVRLFLL